MSIMRKAGTVLLSIAATLGLSAAASAGTLETVKQRGSLNCGVSTGLLGFSAKNDAGEWSGFDVDFCRGLAAAIFNDPTKVTFVPLSAAERFEALKSGKVDLLSRNSTWTLDREASMGLLFAGIAYYDGQGFMVMRKPEVTSALELTGAKVCVQTGTTSQLNLGDFFRANAMTLQEIDFPTSAEALEGLESGRCDVLTADQSALFAERLKLKDPGAAVILPDIISKEPLGPVTRNDDVAWHNVVKWTLFALVNAEELGVSSQSTGSLAMAPKAADGEQLTRAIAPAAQPEAMQSKKPDVRRLIGAEGDFGRKLGLENGWALQAVRAVGNYSEVYERNVGVASPLGIPRGMNQLWSMGGIMYAPPIR
jgi:general L-amino acid transport system substrate-binding protein